MSIKKIELLSIDAKRFCEVEQKPSQIRIDNNSTITMIIQSCENNANMDFTVTVSYTGSFGGMGIIKINGKLIYEGDLVSEIINTWNTKKGNLPPQIANEIHSAIMQVCIPESILIAKTILLPPPIPLPKPVFAKPGKPWVSGPEVA